MIISLFLRGRCRAARSRTGRRTLVADASYIYILFFYITLTITRELGLFSLLMTIISSLKMYAESAFKHILRGGERTYRPERKLYYTCHS